MEIQNNPLRLNRLLKEYHIATYFTDYTRYLPYFELVCFYKEDKVFEQESDRNYLFFFISGKLKVCSNLSNGKSLLVCFYTSFEILGDLELFEMEVSFQTVQAINTCTCIALNIAKIRKQLMEDTMFLQNISKSLAQKLSRATANHTINILYPLENRLASYIMITTKEEYSASQLQPFCENLTQLAEHLGTSYRHLLRTLQGFVSSEILTRVDNQYFIKNRGKLKILAQDLYHA